MNRPLHDIHPSVQNWDDSKGNGPETSVVTKETVLIPVDIGRTDDNSLRESFLHNLLTKCLQTYHHPTII